MIKIDTERCNGCGVCVDVCPTGAIYLVDGTAVVDEALCNSCKECLAVCPTEAIAFAPEAEPHRVPAVRAKPHFQQEKEVIRIRTKPVSFPARMLPVARAALPVAGAVLAWTAREILPQLADLVLDTLEHRTRTSEIVGGAAGRDRERTVERGGGAGRQHRRRQRGRD